MKPTMMSFSSFSIFIIIELLAITTTIKITFCNGITSVGCIESERHALLSFKQHITHDPSKRLASWIPNVDCCTWAGIVCNNLTGHVLELHLQNPLDSDDLAYEHAVLSGKISPTLLDLKHLVHLNLSGNFFYEIPIPEFLGSIRSLRYLDLSHNGFVGMVPQQLGNISHLEYLDLKQKFRRLYVDNFQWLSNLSLLKHLDLSYVNLSKDSDWLSVTNSLPSLKLLRLSSCRLHHSPSLPFVNFSSLIVLDLSSNKFGSLSFLKLIFGLTHLNYLDLSSNLFEGQIPEELQNLTSLRHLDLSKNIFDSTIPNWLYRLSHLENLSLSRNNFKGTILHNFGNLTSMINHDLSFNQLEGKIPSSLGKLCHLQTIYLEFNNLSQVISEIIDIFSTCASKRLDAIFLGDNKLFGHLTHPIGHLKRLEVLDLSNNSISGPLPSSLGELSSLSSLSLSHNKLNGTLSEIHFLNLTQLQSLDLSENLLTLKAHLDWIPPFQLHSLMLSSCNVGPTFPRWLQSQKNLYILDMSNCKISDTIPNWIGKSFSQALFASLYLRSNNFSGPLPPISSSSMTKIDISNNSLSGSIGHFLCSAKNGSNLRINLINNNFSGEIPDCWMNHQHLEVLNLAHNKLSGNLPDSIGSLGSLRSLHLHQNHLSGTIPVSLQNCGELEILDISGNKFAGNVPDWIGEKLTKILILNLRSNKLDGFLPPELCRLQHLQVLDLSYNNLHGRLPRCIRNFNAMVTKSNDFQSAGIIARSRFWVIDKVPLESEAFVTQGKMNEYSTILNLVRKLDLSKNNLSGEIPIEVTHLVELQWLNLSHNSLTGKIPENIGLMTSIQEIDFSCNRLSGEIPQSISQLTFLKSLNLSNNNLIGKIPLGTQLQTFNSSSFGGNKLCGDPLPHNCSLPSASTPENKNKEGNGKSKIADEMLWFYVSMTFGFVVGFWGFIGPLVVNRRWRYMYYSFLDYVGYKIRDVVRKYF